MALEFTINLNGNWHGALEEGNKKLEETEKGAKHAGKELELFEGELGKVRAGALELNFNALKEGGSFFQFDLAEGAKLAYEAIEKVVDKVLELGVEMVKAAGQAEDLNLAIKLDVGEEGEKKVDDLAESFRGTRFSAAGLKKALLPILEESGDEHSDQWDDLVTAATDVATRRNSGAAGAATALEALRSIEIMPQKVRGALKELGIKQKDFYNDLGGLLGISEKAAEDQTKAGKVKAQTLLSVALNEIAQREGGALGIATNEGSKTLGSSIARLANVKDELFEKLAGSQGMKSLQGALDTFVDTLEGPVGNDLINTIDGAFKTLFGDLSGPDGAKKLEAVIVDVTHEVESLIESFREAWPDIKAGAADVWEVLKGIGSTVKMIIDGWREIKNLSHDFDTGQVYKDLADTVTGEHGGIAGDTVNANSPQWKKDRAAAALAQTQDSVIPKFAGGGLVSSPTIALIGESGPEAIVPLGRAFGSLPELTGGAGAFGAPTITYAPSFSFSGGAARDVREQIESFEQQHRVELKKFVDEVRAAVGG